MAAEVIGDVAGEVAGEVAAEVIGDVAEDVTGEAATGDGRGPVEAGAGDEGATVALPNGGRCAVMATMR